MRVLITGAHGFAGRHLSSFLRESGAHVVPLACELQDRKKLEIEVKKASCDYLVHLAAISNPAHSREADVYSTNLLGTINLLEAVRDSNALQKVLLISSANVYGNAKIIPTAEAMRLKPPNHYALSKVAMEYLANVYSDMPLIIARPFNFTGPGQAENFIVPKLVSHFQSRTRTIKIGDPTVVREINHVSFVCSAFSALLKYGAIGEVYNVCSGVGYTISEIIDQLVSLTGHQPEIKTSLEFVRRNDIQQLIGDNRKLTALCEQNGHVLPINSLSDTLMEMINHGGQP